jgi:glyoxylase-like metal-dependent hydrolase (beta-lactamase superfamily II)
MPEDVRSLRVGAATVTLINAGDIYAKLDEWIDRPEGERSAEQAALFERVMAVPIQCIHVRLPGLSLLVDAGRYEAGENPQVPADYRPPPGFLARLPEIGAPPEGVQHVIITHLHGDHFNGLTEERDGRAEPVFPNARHYVGRGDWERPETQAALGKPDSYESRTLGVLRERGLLETVGEKRDLGNGVQIIPAPGESPGHQIVRIQSDGQVLYCLGDLYHHPIEVDPPTCMVRWADPTANVASRRALVESALAEDALLVATHIPGVGRLCRQGTSVTWTEV